MSLNSGSPGATNHLFNGTNFTDILNPPNAPNNRTSIFSNIETNIPQPISAFGNNNPPPSTNVMFTAQPFAPMVPGTSWKCPEWMAYGAHTGLMEFNSVHRPFKRKSSDHTDSFIKSKQLITEEKMAAHFNSLHLSSNYTSHSNESSSNQSNLNRLEEIDDMRLGTEDLEEKLRRAQRITVCEEVRKLQDQPILPQAILERYDKPCKALVLWQPPQRVSELLYTVNLRKGENDDDTNDEQAANSNQSNTEASMDLDM